MAAIGFVVATVTAVLSVAWILTRLVRHVVFADLVWRTSLVVVALTPLLALGRDLYTPWQWTVPVLPPAALTSQQPEDEFGPSDNSRVSPTPIDQPIRHSSIDLGETIDERGSTTITADVPDNSSSTAHAQRSVTAAESRPAPTFAREFPWVPIAMSVWLTGAMLLTMRTIGAIWRTRRLCASARVVQHDSLTGELDLCARRVGVRRPIELASSSGVGSPVVACIGRPVVIVPPSLLDESVRPQLREALLHECAHVRRHDVAFDLLLALVVGWLWPHPLVHLMRRELRRLRELVCDNYVLTEVSPVTYSETLLQLSVGRRATDRPGCYEAPSEIVQRSRRPRRLR